MLVLRDGKDGEARKAQSVVRTLRDARLWRLSLASGLYLYAQVAVIGFGVLFLHDKHSLADHDAANVVAVAQVLAVGLRIGAGRWSDRARSRIGPLSQIGLGAMGSTASSPASR
jgi:fucose permease